MKQFSHLPQKVINALTSLRKGKSKVLQLPKQRFTSPIAVVQELCGILLTTATEEENAAASTATTATAKETATRYRNLKSINLCHNNLDDRAAVPLGQLIKRPNGQLDIVSVAHNNMTSVGIRQLVSDALTSPYITVLNVNGNPGLEDPHVLELINTTLAPHLHVNRQEKQQQQQQQQQQQVRGRGEKNRKKRRRLKGTSLLSTSAMPSFHVAIVGGGVGGLALALALHGKGIPCTVFERDASFDQRHQGYGLTLQQGGRAMKSINVANDIALQGAWSSRHFIFNHEGDVLAFWGPKYTEQKHKAKNVKSEKDKLKQSVARREQGGEQKVDGGDGDDGDGAVDESFDKIKKMGRHNIHIGRQALRGVLHDACKERLPTSSLRWGYKLDHIVTQGPEDAAQDGRSGACTLHFANAATESESSSSASSPPSSADVPFHCDLVVGCDGIRSAVRQQYVGDEMIYLDLMVMLGIFDINDDAGEPISSLELCKERVFQTSDGSTRLFVMPFSTTQSMWQLTFPVALKEAQAISKGGPSSLMKAATDKIGHWHHPIPEILSRTSPELISGYPVYDRHPMDIKSNVEKEETTETNMPSFVPCTLIGDAAHCMSPLKGQGANQALLDAVELADVVENVLWQRMETEENKNEDEKRETELNGTTKRNNHLFLTSALRTFENQMIDRTTSKVLASREACQLLHNMDFLSSEWQSKRKKVVPDMLERVAGMKKNNITAYSDPMDLDRGAFLEIK